MRGYSRYLVLITTAMLISVVAEAQLDSERAQMIARIHQTRQIGLKQDLSLLGTLIARLPQEDAVKKYDYLDKIGMPWSATLEAHLYVATITALGRLGDSRAIPALEKLVSNKEWHFLKPFAKVAIARIKAENAFPRVQTETEWQKKVEIFTTEVGIPLSQLAGVPSDSDSIYLKPPDLPRLSLRALAEMASNAYTKGFHGAFTSLERAGIVWESDIAAWLTVQLSIQPPQNRVSWLMRQIQDKEIITPKDKYLSQAIADLGNDASESLVSWLYELLAERDERLAPRSDVRLKRCINILSGLDTLASRNALLRLRQLVKEPYVIHLLDTALNHPWVFTSDW